MTKLIDEPYKPIYWVVCGLKVIFYLAFIILWIYQAIYNPFKETFNNSNRLLAEGIMAALFALSIIYFFIELYFFYTFKRQGAILNLHICINALIPLIYFSSSLALTFLTISDEPIWDLYSIMTVSLWAISALTLIQDITLIQKDINCIFFKLVKEVFIGIYLTIYIIRFIKFSHYNSFNVGTGYFKNLLISFAIGILNLVHPWMIKYLLFRESALIIVDLVDLVIMVAALF
ncbi:16548_t:CDS:2 [Dentiscutata erythropus]|uniref:16548_t:CDS:1 n=1 Tax=Dentiscutata erythropus TaxID=1348616 RepID=A0A9N9D8R4_9GLOM|nr:16548_t:CDS:2 [Dentiscutata erythropus]